MKQRGAAQSTKAAVAASWRQGGLPQARTPAHYSNLFFYVRPLIFEVTSVVLQLEFAQQSRQVITYQIGWEPLT